LLQTGRVAESPKLSSSAAQQLKNIRSPSAIRDEHEGVARPLRARHGIGNGQALLDATLGDSPAALWVAKNIPRAEAFYRRNGFELNGAEAIDPATPLFIGVRMVR